jgi:hypothetical protein
MYGINIHEDYALYYVNHEPIAEKGPVPAGLPLSLFKNIAMMWSSFGIYMAENERVYMRCSHNYDGTPFEDFYIFTFDGDDCFDDRSGISMDVIFWSDGQSGMKHDYTKMVSKDNNTAYKYRPSGPPHEINFKVHAAKIRKNSGDTEAWFRSELNRLMAILEQLKEETATLENWANSGLSMRVYCSLPNCLSFYHRSDISSERLLKFVKHGLSLSQLQIKMKCQNCGLPPSNFVPVSRSK